MENTHAPVRPNVYADGTGQVSLLRRVYGSPTNIF